jgi:hypothetical protein
LRQILHPIVAGSVNRNLPSVPSVHNPDDLQKLQEYGCVVFHDFLNADEVSEVRSLTDSLSGYNAHVPVFSDGVKRRYDSEYEFNTLSYSPEEFFQNKTLLEKMTNPYITSLVQSYLQCYPTLYSLNCWWHKFSDKSYNMTQSTHRDYDDFKFLAFFIYLTDVDDGNGPHVFYPKTHGGKDGSEQIAIKGKAGTAILADTYALHRGQPLEKGERLLIWWRYGLYVNEVHFHNKEYLYKVDSNNVFDKISDNQHNRHLLRAFLK